MNILEFLIVWQFFSSSVTFLVGVGLLLFIRKKTQAKTKENQPAGFLVRAICLGTDLAIIDVLTSLLGFRGSLVATGYIKLLLTFSYFYFFWLFFAATPAMIVARIKILSQEEKPLKVWQVLVRLLMFVFLIIGWITLLFDKKEKRALHDFCAKTKVVYRGNMLSIEKNVILKIRLVMLGLVGVLLISLMVNGFGEKITKYTQNSQITFFDLNQDTLTDGLTLDVDDDGEADMFKYDLNNDKVIDFTTMDADKDEIAESIDQNNDGRIDGIDFDKDNKLDIKVFNGQFFIWLRRILLSAWLISFTALIVFAIKKENL